MSDLWSLFRQHSGRSSFKWPQYFPAYERHLSRFRGQPCCLLEIGVADGGSLQLWKTWLGPQATIIGIDINPECRAAEEAQIRVFTGDQADPVFLNRVLNEVGYKPDIIIDDGSHQQDAVRATFRHLYPQLTKAGVYCVEDLHCAYRDAFGGGYRAPGSFIETAKGLVDQMHAYYADEAVPVDDFTRTTTSVSFYDSLVVFERGPHPRTDVVRSGAA